MAFSYRLRSRHVCLLGLLAVVSGCGTKQSGPEARPPVVYVEKPVEKEVIDYAFFTGRTDGIESVDVRSRVTGYLDAIDFESGKEVKKDQKLFKIDPRPYKAALDQANGQTLVAEAQLKLAEADYRRAIVLARTPGAIMPRRWTNTLLPRARPKPSSRQHKLTPKPQSSISISPIFTRRSTASSAAIF